MPKRAVSVGSVVGSLAALVALILAVGAWYALARFQTSQERRLADQALAVTDGGNASRGHDIIVATGCGACHQIEGVSAARGQFGPSLKDFRNRATIGGVMANSPDNLVRWIISPPQVDPQTAMPDLGLSEDEARDVAAFLYQ